MNNSRPGCAVSGIAILLLVARLAGAQLLTTEVPQPQLVTNVPTAGTFYLLGQEKSPPYPYDPWFGQMQIFFWDASFASTTEKSITARSSSSGRRAADD